MTTIERRPNKLALLVVALVFGAGGIAWVATRASGDHETLPSTTVGAPASTTTRVTTSTAFATSTTTTTPTTTVAPVASLTLALPSAAGVVLFAHTADPNAVVRVEIDRGRVVTTPIGSVLSTAPAFLAVGPSVAVVRPYDGVPGYVVADSGTVSAPSGLLDDGVFLACSDGRRDRVWLAGDSLVQVDFSGSRKAEISSREQPPTAIGCDGAGEMLYRSGTNTLVTGDGPPTLVTANTVVAAGPRTFLLNECSAGTACALTVIDRATGERRPLTLDASAAIPQRLPMTGQGRVGSISPDGRTAVLFRSEREAVFVEMASGGGQGGGSILGEFQSFAWSSDSRYVFYIGSGYKLYVFDRATREVTTLGVSNVLALASRPS